MIQYNSIIESFTVKPCWEMTRKEFLLSNDLEEGRHAHGTLESRKIKIVQAALKTNGAVASFWQTPRIWMSDEETAQEYCEYWKNHYPKENGTILYLNLKNNATESEEWDDSWEEEFGYEKGDGGYSPKDVFVDHLELVRCAIKLKLNVPSEVIEYYKTWQ